MSLSDFYQPLNILSLFQGLVLLWMWDCLGVMVAGKIGFSPHTRPAWWISGMVLVILIWRLLWPVTGLTLGVWMVVAFFGVISFLGTRRNQKFSIPLHKLLNRKWFFLPLLILAPVLWVKISLPPIGGDETSYHFWPPSAVIHQGYRNQPPDFYSYIPRTLDDLYLFAFTITRSYSLARLFHLIIVLSGLLTVGNWIEKHWGGRGKNIWDGTCLFFAVNLVSTATSGFVDAATASVVLIAISIAIPFAFTALNELFVWWAVAVSFKYSALFPMMSYSGFLLPFWRSYLIRIPRLMLIFIIFGGFWMVRNFVLFLNPVYPITFGGDMFTGWTVPLTFGNRQAVIRELTLGGSSLFPLFITALFVLFVFRISRFRILYLVLAGWFLEALLVRLTGSFIIRYYYHWIFLLGLFTIAPFFSVVSGWRRWVVAVYGCFFAFIFTSHIINTVAFVYSPYFTPSHEVSYSLGRSTINHWVEENHPETSEIINYCGRESLTPSILIIADPELMWFTSKTNFRAFLVNCIAQPLDLKNPTQALLSNFNRVNQTNVLLASSFPCLSPEELPGLLIENADDHEIRNYPYALSQRGFNNKLVCAAQEVAPNLYTIESEKVKDLIHAAN